MNKKNIKILIIVITFFALIFIYSQIEVKPLSRKKEEVKIINKEIIETNTTKVYLKILDKKYETEIKEGSTAFEVMQKIQSENNKDNPLIFKYKEYNGLGIFINEINGLKGGGDGNWLYFVNEKEANVGVSNYKIKNGDIISWKYEK